VAFNSAQIATNASTATPLLVQGVSTGQFKNIAGTIQDPLPVAIQNIDAAIVIYVGGPTVTAATGYPVDPGGSIPMALYGSSEIPYAISASGVPLVAVLVGRQ
jgi:hypothetical protein